MAEKLVMESWIVLVLKCKLRNMRKVIRVEIIGKGNRAIRHKFLCLARKLSTYNRYLNYASPPVPPPNLMLILLQLIGHLLANK